MRPVAEVADINHAAMCAVVDIQTPNILVVGDKLYLGALNPKQRLESALPDAKDIYSCPNTEFAEGWNAFREAMLHAIEVQS
ncbi:hypothetical protein FHW84_002518 [Dyella sp. SG562]|uniref:hypothetical protein n=1 Tax=Dyella sp. SG562 TaxID=2587017 RepID=UPI001423DCDC|nr:hypothetical protein [Dyella sp. SG562]NII73945.1 hypothetical protein [Dyella sp. SG562]